MAISTYGTLKTAVANWLARPDLTDRIPEFIELAEDRIAHDLRIAQMETSADLAVNAQLVAQPDGYLEGRRIYLDTNPVTKLDFMSTDNFWSRYLASVSGLPKVFTAEGTNLVFGPIPDGAYTGKILYYKRLAALSNDSDTNWVLQNARGLYLYGALLEAQPYIRNDPRIATWSAMWDNILDRVQKASDRQQHSGGVLTMRSDVMGA
jgi:hypothetical protein